MFCLDKWTQIVLTKEEKYFDEFVKSFIFFKINKRGVLMKSGESEKIEKLVCRGRLLGT